jgi:hypothetical protein
LLFDFETVNEWVSRPSPCSTAGLCLRSLLFIITIIIYTHAFRIVAWRRKAGIVESKETFIAR